MSYTKGTLVIDNFQRGVAKSSHLGFSDITNADITSIPGVLIPESVIADASAQTAGTFSTTILANIKYGTKYYTLINTNPGKVYQSSNNYSNWAEITGHSTAGTVYDMVYWKDYLVISRGATTEGLLDVYGKLSGTPAWDMTTFTTTDGATQTRNTSGKLFVGMDDILYCGLGDSIATLREVVAQTFDATNSATYVFTQNALNLPKGSTIITIAELGRMLYIFSYSATTREYYIYPWDRTSQSFNIPIKLGPDNVPCAAVTYNGIIYFFTGNLGRLYAFNGSTIELVRELPKEITNSLKSAIQYTVGKNAMTVWDGEILFGLTGQTSTGSSGTEMGVWGYKNGVLRRAFGPQWSGSVYDGWYKDIVTLWAESRTNVWLGYTAKNPSGSDLAYSMGGTYLGSGPSPIAGYGGYAISQFYSVAPRLQPKTFRLLEVRLARPMKSGNGVRVWYRTERDGSWTLLDETTYADDGAVQSWQKSIAITVSDIQIKVSPSGGTQGNTPELLAVILR